MSLDTINVDLGTRSYQVRIGQGLLGQAAEHIAPLLHRKKVAVITDDTVAALPR
jgi:3-dehydroquinate synthase